MALVHELDCAVCRFAYGFRRKAVEAHHIEHVRGEHSDLATVPLCERCHGELHGSRRRSFYRAHKLDDVKLMAWTMFEVEEYLNSRWAIGIY